MLDKILGSLFLVVGVSLLVHSIRGGVRWRWRSRTWRQAEGRVVDSKHDDGYDYPFVQFKDSENETVRFGSKFGFGIGGYRVGDSIPVHYDPRHPARAEIRSAWTTWQLPLLTALLGIGFVAAGLRGVLWGAD